MEQAITLNGVAVETNLAAFRWGRAWIADPTGVERAAGIPIRVAPETTDELIERLAKDLIDFDSVALADRYRNVVGAAADAERAIGSDQFTRSVATHLHKLMAYKDEYEVARLLLADEAKLNYRAVGGPKTKVTYHLHPPMLRALGMDRKLKLQRSAVPALRALRASKRLRGTVADPFRWAEVRKVERAMIPEYIAAVKQLCEQLHASNVKDAAEIAALPDQVRGYEDLKLQRAAAYRSALANRMQQWST
jgi:indolepyruvate ferredoxin oxidoreductase